MIHMTHMISSTGLVQLTDVVAFVVLLIPWLGNKDQKISSIHLFNLSMILYMFLMGLALYQIMSCCLSCMEQGMTWDAWEYLIEQCLTQLGLMYVLYAVSDLVYTLTIAIIRMLSPRPRSLYQWLLGGSNYYKSSSPSWDYWESYYW